MNIGAARCGEYLYERLLPLWRDHGWDHEHGGFHERLDRHLRPLAVGHKRLLVQCRQLYTFSRAAALGRDDGFRVRAAAGFAFLVHRYRDPDGGWFFSVTPEGLPLDRRRDCYGHAFVLFALAHHAAIADDAAAVIRIADETLGYMTSTLADPVHGGFLEGRLEDGKPIAGARRQNPHMHLLEGLLALYEITRDARCGRAADAIVELFTAKFFDEETSTLREYFGADWSPDPERGDVVEPGHHFEWTWLLHEYARLRRREDIIAHADRLYAWGLEHGVAVDGGVLDEVAPDGRPLAPTRRIWPLMELVKASAVREDHEQLARALELLFSRYLLDDGRWNEHLDADGRRVEEALPGSTSYHIFFGLTEAIRRLGS